MLGAQLLRGYVGRLERSQVLPLGRAEVFAFFSDAANLETITPRFLKFKVLTPQPLVLRTGSVIDYRLQLCGIPFRWRTTIEAFEPPDRFVDVQTSGPYRSWRHLHEFHDDPGGTLMIDRVDYALSWGVLGRLAHALFVRRALDRIFDYRAKTIAEICRPQSANVAEVPR